MFRVVVYAFCCLFSSLAPGCVFSGRAGVVGTVRGLSDLGAEGLAEGLAGRICGRGVCSAGLRATGGFFGREPVASVAGKIETMWFFRSNAAVAGLMGGPRFVGDQGGFVFEAYLMAFEPVPFSSPVGNLGAGIVAGWGTGDEAVRGGWFGVGLFWEFADIFSWK